MPRESYQLGLIGYPLGHSLSPRLHAAALKSFQLQGEYRLYPVPPEDREGLAALVGQLRSGALQGLNVTIPHKQTIIHLLDQLSPTAESIGAVNTVFIMESRLVGDNTDAPGFWAALLKSLSSSQAPLPVSAPPEGKGEGRRKGIVLGAGGAARAVVYALLTKGWEVTLAVRPPDVQQAEALMESFEHIAGKGSLSSVLLEAGPLEPLLEDARLIVNATPLGMSPDVKASPWPAKLPFPRSAFLYDLVYNPRETRLVRDARAAGLSAATGLGMLVEQAARSFEIWTGRNPDRRVMFSSVEG
jgi:shikimate dehydrogenase